jgi:hypothetical protein
MAPYCRYERRNISAPVRVCRADLKALKRLAEFCHRTPGDDFGYYAEMLEWLAGEITPHVGTAQ